MTIAAPCLTGDALRVKAELMATFERMLDWLLAMPMDRSVRDVESETWTGLLTLGALVLAAVLAVRCRDLSLDDIRARQVPRDQWRFRMDRDYLVRLSTTFGRIEFPSFAWRDLRGPSEVTHTPSLGRIVPLRPKCRSSTLLLEWECRAGADAPFRRAADMLRFFSHGAIDIEDTTISAHLVRVGTLVDRAWQYRTRDDIVGILRDRATRARGGMPILYASTDACSLRRFVDETTAASWKNANGLRFWCTDKVTGETIHLGGEYTWLDCTAVEEALVDLDARGLIPRDGNYDDVHAQITVVTDGQPWIHERMVGWFTSPVAILDPYHLIERLGNDAKVMFGEGTTAARRWMARAVGIVLGRVARSDGAAKLRAGRKHQRREPKPLPAGACPSRDAPADLLAHVLDARTSEAAADVRTRLANFIEDNLGRIAYRVYRWRGFLIGSGAMESLHRTAVQARIKLPGCRWLAETSDRIFAIRMMTLAGRWDEFWAQPDLSAKLVGAFRVEAA